MSSNTTYLITGANRGIGKGLLMTYLSRDNTTVIAGVRDPKSESSKALSRLSTGQQSRLILVKIDSTSEGDAARAAKTLQSDHNVGKLDVVVANAGISTHFGPVATAKVAEVQEHISINAFGPLLLFQSVLPLLQKARDPKFVVVSSPLGSIGGMELRPFPLFSYGASKAILNYLVRKIHFEHEDLISFAVDPGFVQTDMGNTGAQFFGLDEAPTTINVAVEYLVNQIDSSTREKTSGHFASIEGGDFAW